MKQNENNKSVLFSPKKNYNKFKNDGHFKSHLPSLKSNYLPTYFNFKYNIKYKIYYFFWYLYVSNNLTLVIKFLLELSTYN